MKKAPSPAAVFLCLFLALPSLAAQDRPDPPAAGSPESQKYYIRSVDFEVQGRWTLSASRPFALMQAGGFVIGERFHGLAALKKYIAGKTRLLMNQRVLESAAIEYTPGEEEEDGALPVDLLVRVKDTWNIIALPYPKYDDNTGFELILKFRDYNFLGTMNPLQLDLGYKLNLDDEHSFIFEIDSDTPFRAFGFTWNLNFDHALSYTPDDDDDTVDVYYRNTTGLSLNLPFHRTTFTFGLDEYFIVNEENADADKPLLGDRFEGLYMATSLHGAWKIPTGLVLGDFGELTYTPGLTGTVNYRPGGAVDESRKGPALGLSHTLGFGRIDWIGNYRRGLEVSAKNSNGYNFFREKWSWNLSLTAAGHLPLSNFFALSGRLRLRTWLDGSGPGAGDDLRGILNRAVEARTMLSLNLDFPFRLFRFFPSEWFNNRSFRFFDFELHLSPFADLALVHGRAGGRSLDFSPAGILCTGGMEVLVFPAFMRSIYLRLSLGYNLREFAETGALPGRELFIGLGHHY